MYNTQLSFDAPLTLNTKSETPGPIVINCNRLGDLAEQWVSMLAAWKGAEVFPNRNCTGPTDLMMSYRGITYMFDVKCATWRDDQSGWDSKHTCLVKAPVWPVVVEPDGDIANWRVRWVRNRYPQELRDFWSKDYRTITTKPTKNDN